MKNKIIYFLLFLEFIWGIYLGVEIINNRVRWRQEMDRIIENASRPVLVDIIESPAPASKNNIVEQIVKIATEEGVDPQTMVDLAWCESNLNPNAVGRKDNDDLGLFQINSRFHNVSDGCRTNVECSTRWTAKKIKAGKIHLWTCWEIIK